MKMKNKKIEQIEAKKRHRESLRASRKKGSLLERKAPEIEEIPTILIVCEGKNTEPSYFKQFRLTSAKIVPIGEGFNTISLVQRAIAISEKCQYDQVWVVFDKDDFKSEDFNNAINIAKASKFKVGYSNQAFEYWLLLHLSDHQGGSMHRDEYNSSINKFLKEFGIEYDGKGSKKVEEDFFDILMGTDKNTGISRMQLAIDRAERNFNYQEHENPSKAESSTTVYILAREIQKHMG